MIANGKYQARSIEAKLGHTETKKEQAAVLFEIKGPAHQGEQITWYGYFTDATIDRTLETLELCGWDGNTLADLSSIGGRDVELVIEQETYNGVTRARVRWVNQPGGGGVAIKQQLTPAEAAAFAKRMHGAVLARKQARAQQPRDTDEPPF